MKKGKVIETFIGPFGGRVKRYFDSSYEGIKCPNYSPCPVCSRCENKFPEKYQECLHCPVKADYHNTSDKSTFTRNGRRRELKSKTKERNKIKEIKYE